MLFGCDIVLTGTEVQRLKAKSLLGPPLRVPWSFDQNGNLKGRNGKRIQELEKITHTKIDIIQHLEGQNSELLIRGLPSLQHFALDLCRETTQVFHLCNWGGNCGFRKKLDRPTRSHIDWDKKRKRPGQKPDQSHVYLKTKKKINDTVLLFYFHFLPTQRVLRELKEDLKLLPKIVCRRIPMNLSDADAREYVIEKLKSCGQITHINIVTPPEEFKKKKDRLAYVMFADIYAKMKAIKSVENVVDVNFKLWHDAPECTGFIAKIPSHILQGPLENYLRYVLPNAKKIYWDYWSTIGMYKAYIRFPTRQDLDKAIRQQLMFEDTPLVLFPASKWKKEALSYEKSLKLYSLQFPQYLQYLCDIVKIDLSKPDSKRLTLENLPKKYEAICGVRWLDELFVEKIYEMYAQNQLDTDVIQLNEKEIEIALRKYSSIENTNNPAPRTNGKYVTLFQLQTDNTQSIFYHVTDQNSNGPDLEQQQMLE
ncbi:hypothetical protein RFI_12016 [Reticulomyxa filosa]|uniref:Uncharacterized protein n=1 Tax=Reticulomyxa filosa TaxID=46433 RepID=X6NHB2_RETFI|nr:hypothetical protein RFI_12016 [Reticulomyxa filosa]|eukprot:ETO25129.1 hypothetical protein RFI_12016 [Reticulomyxa filosa]